MTHPNSRPEPYDPPPAGEAPTRIGPDPFTLADQQWSKALDWLHLMQTGAGRRWMWPSIHRLTGKLLPTWTVFLGGYPKTAKTTLLQTQARCWAEQGIRVAYVGTETNPELLRLQSAALTLGLPVETVLRAEFSARDEARVAADLKRQSELGDRLMYADTGPATLAEVLYWMGWGADHGAEIVIFDHLHRLDTGGGSDRYGALSDAVRALNSAAQQHGVTLLCAAQFRERKDDHLANHEVPADGQWFGTAAIQQEAVVALQCWRPLRSGVSPDDKAAVRRGDMPIRDVLRPNTVAIRVSAHRLRPSAYGEIAHLRIIDDVIDEFTAPLPERRAHEGREP